MNQLEDVFIGRQPIFDKNLNIYGYEMLFRSGNANVAELPSEKCATSVVLANLFENFGFKNLVGDGKRAFVNFTGALLTDENEPFFSPETVIIEVLEDVQVTPLLVKKIKQLKKKGYRIALDDYVFSPDLMGLEPLADIIKVDLPKIDNASLEFHVNRIKSQGIRLLAEKVETHEEFEMCKTLGFDLFQGYFFAKPQIVQGKSLSANQLTLLRLLSKIYDPSVNICTIVDLVKHDVALSQKILCVGSSLYPNVEVNSIHDAISKFGIKKLQSWLGTQILSGAVHKTKELFKTALLRARFCELIGTHLKSNFQDAYYTVGLLSVLDALFDREMSLVLQEMTLEKSIKNALTQYDGELGQALICVKSIENGCLNYASGCPESMQPLDITKHYLAAVDYANRMALI